MSLPASFSYFANRLAGVSRRNVKLTPNNSSTVQMNSSIEWVFPDNAIVDLTTATMTANFGYKNAATATAPIRYVPQPHTLLRSANWQLSGNTVCGSQLQHFGQVFEALRRASSGESHVKSREDEYRDVPAATLMGGAVPTAKAKVIGNLNERVATDTQSRRIHLNDFLGLQNCPNAPNWDTSLVGSTRLVLQLNGSEVVLAQADDAYAAGEFDWELTGLEMSVDVISFADPTYDVLMSSMLSEPEAQLLIPFTEYTSQKSTTSANIRFNIASSSLDMLAFAPLHADHTGATTVTTASGNPTTSNIAGHHVGKHTQYCYRDAAGAFASANAAMSDSCDGTFFWTLNGQVLPARGATNIQQGAEYTKQLYSASKEDNNGLFMGYQTMASVKDGAGAANTEPVYIFSQNKDYCRRYARIEFLDNNCITAIRTCLDVPAAQSASHQASGVSTLGSSSSCSLSLSDWNANDSILLFGAGSGVLAVGAGQQVAVQY